METEEHCTPNCSPVITHSACHVHLRPDKGAATKRVNRRASQRTSPATCILHPLRGHLQTIPSFHTFCWPCLHQQCNNDACSRLSQDTQNIAVLSHVLLAMSDFKFPEFPRCLIHACLLAEAISCTPRELTPQSLQELSQDAKCTEF